MTQSLWVLILDFITSRRAPLEDLRLQTGSDKDDNALMSGGATRTGHFYRWLNVCPVSVQ